MLQGQLADLDRKNKLAVSIGCVTPANSVRWPQRTGGTFLATCCPLAYMLRFMHSYALGWSGSLPLFLLLGEAGVCG